MNLFVSKSHLKNKQTYILQLMHFKDIILNIKAFELKNKKFLFWLFISYNFYFISAKIYIKKYVYIF